MADQVEYFEAGIVFISPSVFPHLSQKTNVFTDAIVFSESTELVFGKEVPSHRFVLACKPVHELLILRNDVLLNVCLVQRFLDEAKMICSKFESSLYTLDLKNIILLFVAENLKNTLEDKGFRSHQESNLSSNILSAYVRKITPLPLSKVVFEVKTEESYQWANKELRRFLTENACEGCGVLREREFLPISFNLNKKSAPIHLVHTEPFVQGTFTSKTCIVVSKMISTFETDIIHVPQNNVEDNLLTLSAEPLLISEFTNTLTELISPQGAKAHNGFTLNAKLLHLGIYWQIQSETDQSSKGFVSMETLSALKLFHGTWIKILVHPSDAIRKMNEEDLQHIQGSFDEEIIHCSEVERKLRDQQHCSTEDETEKMKFHIVQLCCTESKTLNKSSIQELIPNTCHGGKLKTHVLYVSPLLYYNLTGCCYQTTSKEVVLVSVQPVIEEYDKDQDKEVNSSKSTLYKPPFVREAHISPVTSPDVKSSDLFKRQLTDYFTIPRLLKVGDVFFVKHDWRKYFDDTNTAEDPKPRDMSVFFKVTKLIYKESEREFGFVDSEHSSLYQKGVINSYVPVQLSDSVPQSGKMMDSSFLPGWDLQGLQMQVDSLEKLVKPFLNCRNNRLCPTGILVTGPVRCGKTSIIKMCSWRLNLQLVQCNCYDLCGDSVAAVEARIKNLFQKASFCSPCILLLRNIQALGKDREGTEDEPRIGVTLQDSISLLSQSDWPVITIATSSSPNDISNDIFSCFLHKITLEAPSEEERCELLMSLTNLVKLGNDVSVKQLSRKTAGFVLGDFVTLLCSAARVAAEKALDYCMSEGCLKQPVEGRTDCNSEKPLYSIISDPLSNTELESDICSSGVRIHNCDIEKALESLQASHSDSLGAPKIPSVKWDDVGGLLDVKADILDTIQLPLQHPELFASGLRRSGVLLYGPPGTGKTLLAKAVATECSLNFLSVKGPELINMYVGQSEQNVREVFARAQSASPCVIFFDELDSLAPNRGRSGDSGGVMDRVVSQLLAELDGLHKSCDVFVIGATNRPDLLDPALLRPGRFDKMLYLGVSKEHDSQLTILKALTRKFSLDPSFSLEDFSLLCPLNLTGADLYSLCSDAMLQAIKRNIAQLQLDGEESLESEVMVVEKDFLLALDNLVPSVSFEELRRFERLQRQFLQSK